MNDSYFETDVTDDLETEALRERLINELEGAYLSGIGSAVVDISAAKSATKEELLLIARR